MKRPAIAPATALRRVLVALALGVAAIPAHAGGIAPHAIAIVGALESRAAPTLAVLALDSTTEDRILALDPEALSAADVRDILSLAPAPRIIVSHRSARRSKVADFTYDLNQDTRGFAAAH